MLLLSSYFLWQIKASWQWYDRSKLAKPANMDFTKVTRVNYAFFQLDEKGNIWGTDEWADVSVAASTSCEVRRHVPFFPSAF